MFTVFWFGRYVAQFRARTCHQRLGFHSSNSAHGPTRTATTTPPRGKTNTHKMGDISAPFLSRPKFRSAMCRELRKNQARRRNKLSYTTLSPKAAHALLFPMTQ
jgi:hypothetical protein